MTTEGLHLETQAGGDAGDGVQTQRLVATGDLDLATAPILGERVDALISSGATVIILDAAGIEFLDSSGVRVLVQASNALEPLGGRLSIENMSAPVERVLEITGLLERYRSPAG